MGYCQAEAERHTKGQAMRRSTEPEASRQGPGGAAVVLEKEGKKR